MSIDAVAETGITLANDPFSIRKTIFHNLK
jgi:hypothetical protein